MLGRCNSMQGITLGIPTFSYTGSHLFIDEGNNNWKIKFFTSGIIAFQRANFICDIFAVGGGGGGSDGAPSIQGGGGGGGYTKTDTYILNQGLKYWITIGNGGANGATGSNGEPSKFGAGEIPNLKTIVMAEGGQGAYAKVTSGSNADCGGNGGSGGGSGANVNSMDVNLGKGGSDGGDGYTYDSNKSIGGKGQGFTTREFAESTGDLYAGGGGGGHAYGTGGAGGEGGGGKGGNGSTGGATAGSSGAPNTGGGGGGGGRGNNSAGGGPGGSGIVIIRNHRF